MPAALIEVRCDYSVVQEIAIMDAVQTALIRAFRVPETDRNVRLISHLPHRFTYSPELARPELRTIVTIECFAGRSTEAKRHLYREIVEGLEKVGIPADHVSTILHEIELQNWGVGGGLPASDVDLGFSVEI